MSFIKGLRRGRGRVRGTSEGGRDEELTLMGRCCHSAKGMDHISGASIVTGTNNSATMRTKTMEEAPIDPTHKKSEDR